VQLRQDNALGTLYNMVGFQTKLKLRRADRIFRMIPGPGERRVRPPRRPAPQHLPQLADAARRFAALKSRPRLRFAGQITGCEGYVESAAIGLLAGRFAAPSGSAASQICRRRRPPSAHCSAILLVAISCPTTNPASAPSSR
jgi:methylenetetrahydrofolate--tRNA-(uracil-5-)-methyltransferase